MTRAEESARALFTARAEEAMRTLAAPIARAIEAAVREEREACAHACPTVGDGHAIYYFGVVGSTPGHYLIDSTFHSVRGQLPCGLGAADLDGTFCGDHATEDRWRRGYWPTEAQRQGFARVHHVRGWTVVAFWDRSGDPRGASNSAIVVEGEHDLATALAFARERFTHIMARIERAFRIEACPR